MNMVYCLRYTAIITTHLSQMLTCRIHNLHCLFELHKLPSFQHKLCQDAKFCLTTLHQLRKVI